MAASPPRSPPETWTTTIRDTRGHIVRIRPIGPPDAALLVDLFQHLSPETRYRRFLAPLSSIPDDVLWREATRLASLEPERAAALIALEQEHAAAHAIGVARLIHDADDPTSAEVGVVVRDDRQNEGLGTLLLKLLLQLAQALAAALNAFPAIHVHPYGSQPTLKLRKRSGCVTHFSRSSRTS